MCKFFNITNGCKKKHRCNFPHLNRKELKHIVSLCMVKPIYTAEYYPCRWKVHKGRRIVTQCLATRQPQLLRSPAHHPRGQPQSLSHQHLHTIHSHYHSWHTLHLCHNKRHTLHHFTLHTQYISTHYIFYSTHTMLHNQTHMHHYPLHTQQAPPLAQKNIRTTHRYTPRLIARRSLHTQK